tara:strand:- start:6676 stop:6900 length:225 start_codon:yes stop_codon:yes gene_type:complete
MAMRNPSTLLYMNINKNLNKEEPTKNNNKGLLTRDNNRGTNNMSKQNEATKPLVSVVNHLMQIRNIRKDLNGTE